jgi:ectoine hydroxylase-related dioxygenase (phytanoyl-CoA dioxygenase family)
MFSTSRTAELSIQLPVLSAGIAGLFSFPVVLREAAAFAPDDQLDLTIYFSPSETTAFRKSFAVAALVQGVNFPVNSHLLPNGQVSAVAELSSKAGRLLARAELPITINNYGDLADSVRRSMRSFGTPLVVDGPCDSSYYDFSDASLTPWYDRPDATDIVTLKERAGLLTQSDAAQLRAFVRDGFVVLENLIEDQLIKDIGTDLEDVVARRVSGYEWGSSQRIENLHLSYPSIRGLWAHPRVMRMLEQIFGSKACPCQTLTFIFGSEQDPHQDTVHLTPFPAGYMCGVWVAIDDVRPDSGELVVLRGSHRLPRVYMRDVGCPKVGDGDWSEFGRRVVSRWEALAEAGQFEKIIYRPNAGTVLIWHENLMHGGSRRNDVSLSRRSIVSHYFAEGSVAFYDSWGGIGVMVRP